MLWSPMEYGLFYLLESYKIYLFYLRYLQSLSHKKFQKKKKENDITQIFLILQRNWDIFQEALGAQICS
jgi:hypothetical protein